MLNKLIENGIGKCYLYWPTKDKNLKFDHIHLEVELISEKEHDSDFIVREFRLTNLKVCSMQFQKRDRRSVSSLENEK